MAGPTEEKGKKDMPMPIEHGQLRRVPLFAALDADDLVRVAAITHTRSYPRGAIIMLEGDREGSLYCLLAGVVRIFKTSAEGKEQTLRLIQAGHTFNDVPALDGGPNPASAAALEHSDLLITSGAALRALIAERPSIAQATIQTLTQALRHMVGLVEDLSFRHVTARVAKILLEQAALLRAQPQAHRFTQQEMAAQAGTAREMVGRALKELEASGAIAMRQGCPVILNAEFLRMLAS
jgi:CRP-like cAMP-binding protein